MPHENKPYLRWVRTQPCCHCGNPQTEPHHILGIGMGSMGAKASDIHSMPLCRKCHEWVHQMMYNRDEEVAELQVRWVIQTQDKAVTEGIL